MDIDSFMAHHVFCINIFVQAIISFQMLQYLYIVGKCFMCCKWWIIFLSCLFYLFIIIAIIFFVFVFISEEHVDRKISRMIRESSSSLLDIRTSASMDDPKIVIRELDSSPGAERTKYPKQIIKSIKNAMFIAQHIDNVDDFDTVSQFF